MNSITITINENDMNDTTFELLTGMKKGEKLLIPEHIRQAKNITPEEFIKELVNVLEGKELFDEIEKKYRCRIRIEYDREYENYIRKVRVLRNDDFHEIPFERLKVGDVFIMNEATGEFVFNEAGTIFNKATSKPFLNGGAWMIESVPLRLVAIKAD